MHASTFGGGPVVCRAALAVLKAVGEERLLSAAQKSSEYIFSRLFKMKERYPLIRDVRGLGLMIGMELGLPGKPAVENCIKQGLLINCTHDTVLRLMPALNISKKQIDMALNIIEGAIKELK
jgi:acetylornithine/succinyldiaminopimelate/putrescine aminotransferase